jgi:putative aminopeptidase FrvX
MYRWGHYFGLALWRRSPDRADDELNDLRDIFADLNARKAIDAAEAQIERGEGISFEQAFGEKP